MAGRRIGFKPEVNLKHKDGQRSKGVYPAMLNAFGLQESLDTAILYQDLTEAVSASGLCIFTANGCCPSFLITKPDTIAAKFLRETLLHLGWLVPFANRHPAILVFQLFHTRMLRSSTGMKLNLEDFLKIGKRSSDLEQYLNCKFNKKPKLSKLFGMLILRRIIKPGDGISTVFQGSTMKHSILPVPQAVFFLCTSHRPARGPRFSVSFTDKNCKESFSIPSANLHSYKIRLWLN